MRDQRQFDAPAPATAPVPPIERIDTIDILRGVALFGVLVINAVNGFRVSMFEQFLPRVSAGSHLDRLVTDILMIGVELKAFAVFSFLFGLGLAIQFDRLAGNRSRLFLLIRRILVLLAIGLIHLLFIWNGDILTEYAMAAFVVLPWLYASTPTVLTVGTACLGLYIFMPLLPAPITFPSDDWIAAHVIEATRAYGSGTFLEIARYRIGEIPSILPLHVFIFPRTVALMLFGIVAWKAAVLQLAAQQRRLVCWIALGGIAAGGGLATATYPYGPLAWVWLGTGRHVLEHAGTVVLAAGYAAALLCIAMQPRTYSLVAWTAPIGRMAFTNYLMHSVVLGWIFYGYGLGLFGRLGAAAGLLISIGVYVAQAFISRWWLSLFRFGPIEWVWRTLMYAAPQPMLLSHRTSSA